MLNFLSNTYLLCLTELKSRIKATYSKKGRIVKLLYFNNPLCILNNANFNIVDVPVKYKPIDILNSCKCCYLS